MKSDEKTSDNNNLVNVSVNLPQAVLVRVEAYRCEQIRKKGKCNRTDAIIDLIIRGSEQVQGASQEIEGIKS